MPILTDRKVFKTSSNLINPNDTSNFMAGGELRNEVMAGGYYWSPTNIQKLDKSVSLDKNTYINTGEILKITEFGFLETIKVINDMYNVANTLNQEVEETRVYKITVTLESGDNSYTTSKEIGGGSGENLGGYNTNGSLQDMSLDKLNDVWNNRTNLSSLIGGSPITIGLSLYDLVTNKKVSLETRLQGAVVGTVYSTFKTMAFKGITQLAGITQISLGYILGIGLLGAIFDELVEGMLGLDNSFGFGGEYLGNVGGYSMYEASNGILGIGSLVNSLSSKFTGNYESTITNAFGNDIGTITGVNTGFFDNDTSYYADMGMWSGYGATIEEAIANMNLEYMNDSIYGEGMYGMTLEEQIEMEVDEYINSLSSSYENSWDLNGNGLNDSYEKAVSDLTGGHFDSNGNFVNANGETVRNGGSGNDGGDSAFGASTSDAHASGMQGPGREDGTF